MMDIVERLEGYLRWNNKDEIAHDAKREILRLRAEIEDYRNTLNRIAPHDIQGWVHAVLSRYRKDETK